jgi:hypothetical protein
MKLAAALATLLAAAATTFATLGQPASGHESPAVTVSPAEIAKPRPLRHNRHATRRVAQRRTTAAQKLRIRRARRVAQLLAARRLVRSHPSRTVLHRVAKPSDCTGSRSRATPAGRSSSLPRPSRHLQRPRTR